MIWSILKLVLSMGFFQTLCLIDTNSPILFSSHLKMVPFQPCTAHPLKHNVMLELLGPWKIFITWFTACLLASIPVMLAVFHFPLWVDVSYISKEGFCGLPAARSSSSVRCNDATQCSGSSPFWCLCQLAPSSTRHYAVHCGIAWGRGGWAVISGDSFSLLYDSAATQSALQTDGTAQLGVVTARRGG